MIGLVWGWFERRSRLWIHLSLSWPEQLDLNAALKTPFPLPTQVTSNEITAKVTEAEATEKTIDETRENYRPVATRASVLFFCISDLAAVDPMYQYSLAWFISLFLRAVSEAEKVRSHGSTKHVTASECAALWKRCEERDHVPLVGRLTSATSGLIGVDLS